MPTRAVVTIIAAGAGLAFLVRSIISLEDAIDQDNEVSVQDYADSAEALLATGEGIWQFTPAQ